MLIDISFANKALELLAKAGFVSTYYDHAQIDREIKYDNTIVTNVDLAISNYLIAKLEELTEYPVISEENIELFPYDKRKDLAAYWLVDPLDGTKSFANGTDSYCHMISFIANRESVFSVIYLPRKNQSFIYGAKDQGVYTGKLEISFSNLSLEQAKDLVACDYMKIFDLDVNIEIDQVKIDPTKQYTPKQSLSFVNGGMLGADTCCILGDPRYSLTHPQLKLLSGQLGYKVFGKHDLLPAMHEANYFFSAKHSAGVKSFEVMTEPATAYILKGLMSEWDLAPAACLIPELGGVIVDLATGKELKGSYFNKPELFVTPLIMVSQRDYLDLYIDLAKAREILTPEVINQRLAKDQCSTKFDELYEELEDFTS